MNAPAGSALHHRLIRCMTVLQVDYRDVRGSCPIDETTYLRDNLRAAIGACDQRRLNIDDKQHGCRHADDVSGERLIRPAAVVVIEFNGRRWSTAPGEPLQRRPAPRTRRMRSAPRMPR